MQSYVSSHSLWLKTYISAACKKGLNFGEKFLKDLICIMFWITLKQYLSYNIMNVLRVLFIPSATNNNCDDSIADKNCF